MLNKCKYINFWCFVCLGMTTHGITLVRSIKWIIYLKLCTIHLWPSIWWKGKWMQYKLIVLKVLNHTVQSSVMVNNFFHISRALLDSKSPKQIVFYYVYASWRSMINNNLFFFREKIRIYSISYNPSFVLYWMKLISFQQNKNQKQKQCKNLIGINPNKAHLLRNRYDLFKTVFYSLIHLPCQLSLKYTEYRYSFFAFNAPFPYWYNFNITLLTYTKPEPIKIDPSIWI